MCLEREFINVAARNDVRDYSTHDIIDFFKFIFPQLFLSSVAFYLQSRVEERGLALEQVS